MVSDEVGLRRTWFYKLYTEAGEFLKNGITRDLDRRLAEHSRRFKQDVRYDSVKEFSDDVPEGTKYGKQNREALDYERKQNETNPGSYNRERYLKKKLPAETMGATAEYVEDSIERLEKHRNRFKGWGLLQFVPWLGDAITAGEGLGHIAANLNYDRKRSNAKLQDFYLSTE